MLIYPQSLPTMYVYQQVLYSHNYRGVLCTYIPVVTATVPSVLVVFGVERTIHWKVVV